MARNENFVLNFINELFYSPNFALDIGANHGIYTTVLANKFSKVYSFEPHPDNIKIIKEKLEKNNIKNVVLEQKAISKSNGIIDLFINKSNHGGHSIVEQLVDCGRWGYLRENSIKVETVTIDDYCKDKKIDFIKCDIEGGEIEIFYTAVHTLKNNDIKIILETHQVEYDWNILKQFFKDLGYEFFSTSGSPISNIVFDTHYLIKRI